MKYTVLRFVLSLWFLVLGLSSAVATPIISNQAEFDAAELFPSWQEAVKNENIKPHGIIGNKDTDNQNKLVGYYIPLIIKIFIKYVAPIIVVFCIVAGIKLIISNTKEEEITKGKMYLMYAAIGVAIIAFSYSIMKATYKFMSGSEASRPTTTITHII